MSDSKISSLWTMKEEKYSSSTDFQNHLLEQYKLYIEMADRISSRRDTANAFFLSLNGFIVGLLGYFIDKGELVNSTWSAALILSVLLGQCFFWNRLITSYKQLNGAKFLLIGELEEKLPSSPYSWEWQHYLKEGNDKTVYWPLTHIESKIPWVFGFLYLLIFLIKWKILFS